MAAASREAVVVILDVGASMATQQRCSSSSSRPTMGASSSSAAAACASVSTTSGLEQAVKAVELLVQQKLMHPSRDELGLVLFGTRGTCLLLIAIVITETHNQLSEDGYQHITVAREIMGADIDLLRYISTITPEGADVIDALIVGMDLLIRKTAGKRYEKRIFLVTDAGCPVNQDDLDVVCEQFLKIDARLNVIGVGFEEDDDQRAGSQDDNDKAEFKRKNERLIREFAERVHGVVVPVQRAIEMMSFIKPKPVLQRTSHRGCLEISAHVKIPVWSYIKTMERKLPTLKKVSVVSQLSVWGEEEEEGRQLNAPPSRYPSVAPDEKVKGYKYGKTLVPFSMVDEAVLKYEAAKCLQLIGFTSAKNVPRHQFLGNVECIVPEPGDGSAAAALSALAHALAETGSLAIVRYVKRNKGNPYLGCLSPHIKPDFACLYFCALPFAEDLRQYPFASLARPLRKAYAPSEEQLEATQALIDSMDLMTAATDEDGNPMEAVKPKYTYNPALQNLYRAVLHRLQHPDEPSLPPVDPAIQEALRPDLGLADKLRPALDRYKAAFTFTRVEGAAAKVERRYWRDRLADTDVQLESYVPEAKKQRKNPEEEGISMESLMSGATSDVGPINPEQDFSDMLARRDVDLVDKAVEQMQGRIKQLVEDSVGTQLYDKALQYNEFVDELEGYYRHKRRDDFWRLLCARGLNAPLRDTTSPSPFGATTTTGSVTAQHTKSEDEEEEEIDVTRDHAEEEEEATADDLFDMIE
ncbi:ATPdependent DNA helicase [Acanthamoeba castellanii str. Neff]|uniref:ATPdependent DNA helicase n=1 Tax=Acanthamoeba castellanii (strain ATCC 30010 / Neff) TaxID=1257118 RepID=L8H854_ACACF|nr:ATPdependent DNA helicase [Acanthamoeba castellanii str. Neff]ELR21345.1 ATPdependent DNA helicase [Acanthamoeba castellanii str. Neff]